LESVAGVLCGAVVSEGGGHGSFPLYEHIIEHPEAIPGCCVPVFRLVQVL